MMLDILHMLGFMFQSVCWEVPLIFGNVKEKHDSAPHDA